jgi:CRISPR-associated RAMP protein (TIGR02581 family)
MVFEKMEKRLILSGTIEAVTPLHIGSGKPEMDIGDVDMPILRAPDGQPYIPGSSLKGRTRSEVERLAKASGMDVCTPPSVSDMCGSRKRRPEEFCVACRMFGTAGSISVASKLKFRDAYPLKPVDEMLVRAGTAIDRSTGAVARGALYSTEAVPAGTFFGFEAVMENLAPDEVKFLKAALKSVEDSALGGSSSRGFGKIAFHFSKLVERSAGFYLGKEKERVIEGAELEKWFKE